MPTVIPAEDLRFSPTAWLFEGRRHADQDFSTFTVRTAPGGFVELHVHPYAETFMLLEGRARWTAGDDVIELQQHEMLVVGPDTPHGFRNIGDSDVLIVSIHASGTLQQEFLGIDPA